MASALCDDQSCCGVLHQLPDNTNLALNDCVSQDEAREVLRMLPLKYADGPLPTAQATMPKPEDYMKGLGHLDLVTY